MRKTHKSNERLIIGWARRLEEADALWETGANQAADGDLACRRGCFGCCVGLFSITLPEALVLRAAVRELPPAARAGLLARAKRAAQETAAGFPGDPSAGILDPERSDSGDERWFESVRLVPCPALERPSGRCAVYASRPLTCRTYGLAWRNESALVHPPCELNFGGAPDARVLGAAIDAGRLTRLDQNLASAAHGAGLPAGAETTVAHALVGSAFPGI